MCEYYCLSAVTYVQQVLDKIKELQYSSLALVVGRYYAMDRDKRFERNKIAFEGLVQGIGEVASPETVVDVRIDNFYPGSSFCCILSDCQ